MAVKRQAYTTGKNIYAVIRNDAGEVWSTAGTPAFETYSAANYANYVVNATEQGATGVYQITLPATLTAGINYTLDWRVRLSTSAAVSDPCIAMQQYYAVDDIIDAMWDDSLETGVTVRQAMQRMAAVLAGKVSGSGTGVETFKALDGTTDRVQVTVNSSGNRSAVSYDP